MHQIMCDRLAVCWYIQSYEREEMEKRALANCSGGVEDGIRGGGLIVICFHIFCNILVLFCFNPTTVLDLFL